MKHGLGAAFARLADRQKETQARLERAEDRNESMEDQLYNFKSRMVDLEIRNEQLERDILERDF